MIMDSMPKKISPDSAPAQTSSGARFACRHKLAPSAAPNTPPMNVTAYFSSGYVIAAATTAPPHAPPPPHSALLPLPAPPDPPPPPPLRLPQPLQNAYPNTR